VYPAEQTLIEKDVRLSLEDYRNFQKTQVSLLKSNTVLETALSDPNIAKLKIVKEHVPDQVAWLERSLKIDCEGEIMTVSLSGERPEELARIVNEVVDTYIDLMVKGAQADLAKETEQLKTLLEQRRARLKTLRGLRASQQITAGANTLLMQRRHEQVIEGLGRLRKDLYSANDQWVKAEIEFAMVYRQPAPGARREQVEPIISGMVDADPRVTKLDAELKTLKEKREALDKVRDGDTLEHDQNIRETDDKIQMLYEQLAAVREAARGDAVALIAPTVDGVDLMEIEHRRAFYHTYAKHLEGEIKNLEAKWQDVDREGNELAAVDDEIASLEDWINRIDQRVYTLDAELKAPARIRLVEHAPVPKTKWWLE
jgi:hypothetical protein